MHNASPGDAGATRQPPCTRTSHRCEFWEWSSDALRPACCTEHLRDVLFYTADLLARHGIAYWLDYGALLGAVRDGRFIPWDTDADLGIRARDTGRVLALREEIHAAGYWMRTFHSAIQIHYSRRNNIHVDLFPWWEEAGLLCNAYPNSQADHFPPHYVERPEPIMLEGRAFPAPTPVHELLRDYRYGPDYMTPLSARMWQPVAAARYAWPTQSNQGTAARFAENLRLLHDILERVEMAERTWVWRHLLRAWLREHDDHPDGQRADFGYLVEDQERFLAAMSACFAAGFAPYSVFTNSDGRPVHYVLHKEGRSFHFYQFEPEGSPEAAALRYWLHAPVPLEGGAVEFVGRLPLTGWTTWPALDRLWRVPAPPEAWLTAIYGDWRASTPARGRLPQDRSIVQRQLWRGDGSPELMLPPGAPGFRPW